LPLFAGVIIGFFLAIQCPLEHRVDCRYGIRVKPGKSTRFNARLSIEWIAALSSGGQPGLHRSRFNARLSIEWIAAGKLMTGL